MAKASLKRDFVSFTERRPFTALVKTNPRKALSALVATAKTGDYPTAFWSALIDGLPEEVSPRFMRLYLHRLLELPHSIVAKLCLSLGMWLKKNLTTVLKFDEELGWHLYDHVVDGILASGENASKSILIEVRQGNKVIERSRRTFDHAINGPLGTCAEALINTIPTRLKKKAH
jgi:hypothetical protein